MSGATTVTSASLTGPWLRPLDALDPGGAQVLEDGPGAGVDQQARVAVGHEVDVAGVGEAVQVFGQAFQVRAHGFFPEW